MCKILLNSLLMILLLPACGKHKPDISIACEENNVGNSIIKWEITPAIEGKVDLYASTDPNNIQENTPIASANICDQRMTVVTNDPSKRFYYLMVFNDKYRVEIANRNINIPGVQNFRDIGGYKTENGKIIRWGMLYRSAQIDNLDLCSYKELKNIGIRTIIDLREASERTNISSLQSGFNVIHIPIATGNMQNILQQLKEGKMGADTLYKSIEEMNKEIIHQNTKEFKEIFNILQKKECYPIVIHCTSGKGRTGVVTALILSSLGIDEETIMEDYRLSNNYFNIPKASQYAYSLPVNAQEGITTLFSAQEDFLNAAKEEAIKEYGGIPCYLKKGIKLSQKETNKLKAILLK